MAQTMQFDLVSPERSLMSGQVLSVQIPGADGDLTAMPDHAPLITTLRPGILTVETEKGTEEYVVTGGFAEIGDSLSVLAERALPKGDLDQATYESLVDEVQAVYAQTKDAATTDTGRVDDAAKLLHDVVALAATAGLTAKTPTL